MMTPGPNGLPRALRTLATGSNGVTHQAISPSHPNWMSVVECVMPAGLSRTGLRR